MGRVSAVLITGGAGTVAGAMVRGAPEGVELHVTSHVSPVPDDVAALATVHPVDLADRAAVGELLAQCSPDVVVHAAYRQSERRDIVDATEAVAAATASRGASLVHLSTDAVFDGEHAPYSEDDEPEPVHDYGRWKLDAERAAAAAVGDVCITRSSLVVRLEPPDPGTARLKQALSSGETVTLYEDEVRQPVMVDDLAAALWAIVSLPRAGRAGVWHLPGPERLTRLELGRRIAAVLDLPTSSIRTASAKEHPSPRPLDLTMLGDRWSRLGLHPRPIG